MMQPFGWTLAAGLALGIVASVSGAQVPQSPAAAAPANTIVGQVVDGNGNRGVGEALVALTMSGAGPGGRAGAAGMGQPRVITDNDGRFYFTNVRPGPYSLSASKAGYLMATFGQPMPQTRGTTLDIAAGQDRLDVKIVLWRFAAISGVVRDEADEPVVRAAVHVKRLTFAGGQQSFTSAGIATTDDRGMFRVDGLVPASYLIAVPSSQTTLPIALLDEYFRTSGQSEHRAQLTAATHVLSQAGAAGNQRFGDYVLQVDQRGVPPPEPASSGQLHVYPTTYHPASTAVKGAEVITVGSGDERSGIDVRIRPIPAVRVSGSLVWPSGASAPTTIKLLTGGADDPDMGAGFEPATTVADASGRFTLLGVPTGQYSLQVHRTTGRAPSATNGIADPAWWASETIAVGATDITDLSIPLRPGRRVSGRVEFDGSIARPDFARSRFELWLEPIDRRMAASTQTAMFVEADGRFLSEALPAGRYRIVLVGGVLTGWTLKNVMVAGRDVSDEPFELKDADVTDAIVTFTDTPTRVMGTVRDDRGVATGEAYVVVLPADRERWTGWGVYPRRLADARATNAGVFSFPGLVPGDYLIAALPQGRYDFSPAFFEMVSRIATRVTVVDGQVRTIDLRVAAVRK